MIHRSGKCDGEQVKETLSKFMFPDVSVVISITHLGIVVVFEKI